MKHPGPDARQKFMGERGFHVKHGMEPVARLANWLSEAGVRVEADTLNACVRHARWLLDENERINLTAARALEEVLRLHTLDSLLALSDLSEAPPGLLVDIGTGGGFPGVPLALASGRESVLLDSVAKKANALSRYLMTENLGTWISVSASRSEAFARLRPACAAVVVTRAVAELPVLAELAAPILAEGGLLIAMKGEPTEVELNRGGCAATLCGLEPVRVRRYRLPDGGERRANVVYRRVGEPTVPLPRREGMAAKRPLA